MEEEAVLNIFKSERDCLTRDELRYVPDLKKQMVSSIKKLALLNSDFGMQIK
jgi:hypothetical protein